MGPKKSLPSGTRRWEFFMAEVLRIGNAQAFWGDSPGAPRRLLSQQPDLDYLTLDYLAEVSLSILAEQREREPSDGYARDFVDVVRSIVPLWRKGMKTRLVSNAGGLNPLGCGEACRSVLRENGCSDLSIYVVGGDDVLSQLKSESGNESYKNLETGESIGSVIDRLVTANAYLGAEAIAQALGEGADIVVTGRVADPSLTVAACMAHFGWSAEDYDRIGGATVAGHLIECGTQVTGGISTDWLKLKHLTASRVEEYFKTMGVGEVVRFEVPNLKALNFVLPGVLAGGGSRSLRIDAQGKALGQALLEMELVLDA